MSSSRSRDGARKSSIGAHYDAARLPDGTLSRGAVDNAASTVILVRLAETLSKMRLRTQTRIVFFDMEELGLLGSAEFVRAHRDRPMRAMVNLDVNAFGDAVMIGPRTASNGVAFESLRASCVADRSRVRRVSPHAAERRHQFSERRHPGGVDGHGARGAGASTLAADQRRQGVRPADRIYTPRFSRRFTRLPIRPRLSIAMQWCGRIASLCLLSLRSAAH